MNEGGQGGVYDGLSWVVASSLWSLLGRLGPSASRRQGVIRSAILDQGLDTVFTVAAHGNGMRESPAYSWSVPYLIQPACTKGCYHFGYSIHHFCNIYDRLELILQRVDNGLPLLTRHDCLSQRSWSYNRCAWVEVGICFGGMSFLARQTLQRPFRDHGRRRSWMAEM